MSGGNWDPHFDVLHQVVDAYEALRERELEQRVLDSMPYHPPSEPERDPELPPLMEHRLPSGHMLVEPTVEQVCRGTYGARAWFEHFGGWDPGQCTCLETQ